MTTRTPLPNLGRVFFAIATLGFGVQYVMYGHFVRGLPPAPSWTPGAPILAYVLGALLIVAAASIATGFRARLSATVVGLVFVGCVVFLHSWRLGAILTSGDARTGAFEPLALGAAALVLAGTLPSEGMPSRWASYGGVLAVLGRFLFAISLVVFGAQHFMYAAYIATLIPDWIPFHLFWVYFTGCSFIASGLAIGSGLLAKLGANLIGLMFFLWVIVLHGPLVASHLHSGDQWSSAFVALGMCGAAWIVAGAFPVTRESTVRP